MNNATPYYIPKRQKKVLTRNNHILNYYCRTDCFIYSFFSSLIKNWFTLNEKKRNSRSIVIFKSRLLPSIRPIQSSVYNIFDPIGLKRLIRLQIGFSHLNGYRFRHNFQDYMNPLCSCTLLKIHFVTFCTAITILHLCSTS